MSRRKTAVPIPVVEAQENKNLIEKTAVPTPVVEGGFSPTTEPIKPVLLENEVPISVGEGNRTILNSSGVEVEISSTAAKILAGMNDKSIKFIK